MIIKKQMTSLVYPYESYAYSIETEKHLIQITGGSVKFFDRATSQLLSVTKGFTYLYTGDVKPDGTELMALENGKHFYIFSLDDFTPVKKVTLPRGCYASDVYGKYSDDGKILYIPVMKSSAGKEGFEVFICQYSTDGYSLVQMDPISYKEYAKWYW